MMEELLLGAVLRSQEVLGEYVQPDKEKSAEETVHDFLGILDDQELVSAIHDEYGQTIQWPGSSNVKETTYTASKELLEVEFNNGGVYQYKDVPKEEWNEMKVAESVGSYMHQNIKGEYRYEKITATPQGRTPT